MAEKKQQSVGRKRGRPSRNQEDVGRKGILDATVRQLRRTDPSAITRQMIAAEAGVDPNLIRYYFGDMSRLLLEVTMRANRKARVEITKNVDNLSFEDRFRLKVDKTFNLFSLNPFLHKLVTTVLNDTSHPEVDAEWRATLEDAVADMTDALNRAGLLTTENPTDASFLHILVISVCEFWTNNPRIVDILFRENGGVGKDLERRYLAFVVDVILNGISARGRI